MSAAQKLIGEVIAEHRGTVSCVGPDAWESHCDCEWSSGYFYEGGAKDEARWEHDAHVAAEVDKALGGLTQKVGMVHGECDCGNECHPSWCDEKCSSQKLLALNGAYWVSGWTVTE